MEAKDIVEQEVARQKEFGYEPSWEDFVIAGQEAGIREVVEWLDKVGMNAYAHSQTRAVLGITITKDEWQAKLKEWGIERS